MEPSAVLPSNRKSATAWAAIAALMLIRIAQPAAPAMAKHLPKFTAVSITPCEAFRPRPLPQVPGNLQMGCTSLQRLIEQAYGLFANGQMHPWRAVTVSGGPTWINSDLYEIAAKAPGQTRAMMNGPMLQALLEERFQLQVHRDTQDVPVYALTAAKGALRLLQPFQGTCIPWDSDDPPMDRQPDLMCANVARVTSASFDLNAATIADLCMFFGVTLDRPVLDRTGITGRFNFHLDVPTADIRHQAHGLSAFSNPATRPPPSSPAFVSAARNAVKKLGLNLQPTIGPVEFLIIDSVSKP